MAVQKVKARKQINYFLPMVERQLILPYVMTVLGKENFVGAKGDTANIKITEPSIAIARDYDFRGRTGPIVLDDIYQAGGSIPVKLTSHVMHATGLELEHFTLDDLSFASEVLGPQAEAVVSRVESKALAGFRNLHPKHTPTLSPDDDPHMVAIEAKRLMDSDKVAPAGGRVFLVGTDVAAAFRASDRLSEANLADTVAPNLRDAVIGKLSGALVIEHNGFDPNEAFYMHSSGLVLGSVAPDVPKGATAGSSAVGKRGIAATWIQDYDANYARDRSMVHTFLGVNEIRDERNADGSWIVEEGEFDDDDLEVMRNRDGSDVVPAAVGTRKNVRIIKFDTSTGWDNFSALS